MNKKKIKTALLVFMIFLPVIVYSIYEASTALPEKIIIATGTKDGLYRPLMERLADEIEAYIIERKLNMKVVRRPSIGSLDNLHRLCMEEEVCANEKERVDFGLYQPRTLEAFLRALKNGLSLDLVTEHLVEITSKTAAQNVAFVADLYSQPFHWIVRRGANIKNPQDLTSKTVAIGLPGSGDHAMSLMLLEHFFGPGETPIIEKSLTYPQIEKGFENGSLDAAFITIGTRAKIYKKLFATELCDILPIDCHDALVMKHIAMRKFTIYQGLHRSQAPLAPAENIQTVALGAQLLTRNDVHPEIVELVTRLVLSENFIKKNNLIELLDGGQNFARKSPEFPIHQGAKNYYSAEFDIQTLESIEALYSLIASAVIAAFLGFRLIREKKIKKREHKLDTFIHTLLDIELRQVGLDEKPDANDAPQLQKLLDEVTFLRQNALREFSANELKEDHAAECFIKMCHDLSNKINAKISRQRLDYRLSQLTGFLKKN